MSSVGATYGPLSIDDASHDGDDRHDASSARRSTRSIARWLFRRRRMSSSFSTMLLLPLLLAMLLALASVLLVAFAAGRYHMSPLNILRAVFGIDKGDDHANDVVEAVCASNVELTGYRVVSSVEDMIATRLAPSFSGRVTGDVGGDGTSIASSGFLWDDEDGDTARWRPQGVTTYRGASKNDDDDDDETSGAASLFALVSWYGRADEGYSDRGGRVSFVDVSDMMHRRRRHLRDDATATATTATRGPSPDKDGGGGIMRDGA